MIEYAQMIDFISLTGITVINLPLPVDPPAELVSPRVDIPEEVVDVGETISRVNAELVLIICKSPIILSFIYYV